MSKLTPNQKRTVVINSFGGNSDKELQSIYSCSKSTIYRAKTENRELLSMFKKVDDVWVLNGIKSLEIPGDLCAYDLIITDDEKDGVIYSNGLYVNSHDAIEYASNDIGVCGVLKVGKIETFDSNVYDSSDYSKVLYYIDDISDAFKDLKITYDEPSLNPPVEPKLTKKEYIWNASNKFISITSGRETFNATSEHKNFKEAIDCLLNEDFEKAISLINEKAAITKYVKGNITIENSQLYYNGLLLKSGLVNRILKSMESGEDFEFYLPFLENLMQNPSNKAVMRLYDFLAANDIEITDDGYFIAWKKVADDFLDIYTRTMDNSPGKTLSVPRNTVDENDETTCSYGLHVCSKSLR